MIYDQKKKKNLRDYLGNLGGGEWQELPTMVDSFGHGHLVYPPLEAKKSQYLNIFIYFSFMFLLFLLLKAVCSSYMYEFMVHLLILFLFFGSII